MKKRHFYLTAILLAAYVPAQAGENDARRVAEANIAQWNSAFAKGKVDDIVSLYAANAMLVWPDGSVTKSPDEIRAFWNSMVDHRNGVFTIDIRDVKGENADTVITQTILSDVKSLQNSRQVMKYNYDGVLYSVLKRQSDGSWKAQVQQWNHKGKS
jgi:ketosteroid isomerase-like protein